MRCLSKMWAQDLTKAIYIDIYIYVVKLQAGPIFALLKLNIGPFFVFLFSIFENLILPAERRGFLKTSNKQQEKKHNF